MASLSIRGIGDDVRDRLRVRAARHNRSMEAEARAILTAAVQEQEPRADLFTSLRDRFAELGGVELDLPSRDMPARAADLST